MPVGRSGESRDLHLRIERELRERIQEAVEAAVWAAMVDARRQRPHPLPPSDSSRDRSEFARGVRALLERLQAALEPALDPEQRRRAAEALDRAGGEPTARHLALQVALARSLPDYWQRFTEIREAFARDWAAPGRLRRRR